MKKIGIITIYDENNYGNRLQNYATQEVLKSLGCDVVTIKNVRVVDNINTLERAKKIIPGRRDRFLEFNENINVSDYVVFHDDVPENFHENFDYFIIGSDQIWNYSFWDRFSDFSFATFAPKEKRIAFSASFALSKIPEELYERYSGLNDLKAISVRENAGKQIVKDITGRDDCTVLIDPTLMLSSEKWSAVMKRPEQLKSNKYIFKYFLGNVSKEINDEIEKFAKENGCDIVDILDKDSFYTTGPSEFLYLVKNSFMVLTDSFHSCVFSIIFNKPFLIFERDEDGMRDMNSRVDTLIEKLKLSNKKFTGKITTKNLETDYLEAPAILLEEQNKSIEFLKNALDIH